MYFKYRNTLHTPQKCKKIAVMKNILYFLPVVYVYVSTLLLFNTQIRSLDKTLRYSTSYESWVSFGQRGLISRYLYD